MVIAIENYRNVSGEGTDTCIENKQICMFW